MANGPLGYTSSSTLALTDRFEVIKEIGDGSFGSVVLAKVRSRGEGIARRGSVVAIKTMKKTFESFTPCLELREVIFLRQLPAHVHLVPALDIFLDPYSKKLHIAMEYMDGNLYQLMKAREGKVLEVSVVKSILFQILSGLEHIHANGFFHRDIKPENILVSTSAHTPSDMTGSFRRYSQMVTPPSTPPAYSVKIADFGLAREMSSKMPYTTYVSTRWYRAPEVLLRAGEYSAPVDIWAVGAMAVEVATLKPLFPGGNEVDQVWRVCEVMGSPGQWVGRGGRKMGGGEWREGARLAGRLGFSFPRMAPVPIESILPSPTWPSSLAHFVTWCLMWDPRNRPTSIQALQHEFFRDAIDPLQPRATTPSRMLKKSSELLNMKASRDSVADGHTLEKKGSWFRKSFIGRSDGVVSPPPTTTAEREHRARDKRSTWHAPKANSGKGGSNAGAPMMILPSIKPISPLSDAVSVQAARGTQENVVSGTERDRKRMEDKAVRKIGRQLSVASTNSQNGYNAVQEAVDKLNGHAPSGFTSPTSGQPKESFFSHLRKRARRLSGRPGAPMSPGDDDDLEAGISCGMAWSSGPKESGSNRSSVLCETSSGGDTSMAGMDKAIREVDAVLEDSNRTEKLSKRNSTNTRRNLSFPPTPNASRGGDASIDGVVQQPSTFSKTRRSVRDTKPRYETPDEHDELADEILAASSGDYDSRRVSQNYDTTPVRKVSQRVLRGQSSSLYTPAAYPTPSPHRSSAPKGIDIGSKPRREEDVQQPKWPTPPSEEEGSWMPAYASQTLPARR